MNGLEDGEVAMRSLTGTRRESGRSERRRSIAGCMLEGSGWNVFDLKWWWFGGGSLGFGASESQLGEDGLEDKAWRLPNVIEGKC